MKFSFRQILASAGGAVIAAVIASIFGVKGTIVGVAIGSAAATFGTAVVAQSIERGHEAVRQVVVRAPDTASLLRRLGGTGAVGVTESTPSDPAALTEDAAASTGPAGEAVAMDAAGPLDHPVTEQTSANRETPATEEMPTAEQASVIGGDATPRRGIRWPAVAGIVAVVFVVSLMFVTAIELIAGKPLADLFGGHSKSNAPSLVQPFESPTTTTSTSTSTTTSTSSTTTTTTSSTTTTVVGETTTTGSGAGTTTSTTVSGPTTTTTTTSSGAAG